MPPSSFRTAFSSSHTSAFPSPSDHTSAAEQPPISLLTAGAFSPDLEGQIGLPSSLLRPMNVHRTWLWGPSSPVLPSPELPAQPQASDPEPHASGSCSLCTGEAGMAEVVGRAAAFDAQLSFNGPLVAPKGSEASS